MIFLRYESFRGYLRMYPVTSVLIALCIIVFILDALSGGMLTDKGMFISDPGLDRFGLQEPWRYVTSIFLHDGFYHLFFNMFSILIFAPPLERMLGHFRYALFYLICGIIGDLFMALLQSPTYAVGASGAIYGVFGAYLYLAVMKKTLDDSSRKTIYTILIFGILYTLFVPGIGIWAHFGGLFAGFVLSYGYDWYLIAKRHR